MKRRRKPTRSGFAPVVDPLTSVADPSKAMVPTLRVLAEERRGFPSLGDAHKSEYHALTLVQARYAPEILSGVSPSLRTTSSRQERDELGWKLMADCRRHWCDPYLFVRHPLYLGVAITHTLAVVMGGFNVLVRRAQALARMWNVPVGWIFPTLVRDDMDLASAPNEKGGHLYTDSVLIGVDLLMNDNLPRGVTDLARNPEPDEWKLSDVAPKAMRPRFISAISRDEKTAYRPLVVGVVPAWIVPLLMSDAFHDKHVYDPLGRANAMRVAEAIRGMSLDLVMQRVPMNHALSKTMLDRCIAFLTYAPCDTIQELLLNADRQQNMHHWKMQQLLDGFTRLQNDVEINTSAILSMAKTTKEQNATLQRQNDALRARVGALEEACVSLTSNKRKFNH